MFLTELHAQEGKSGEWKLDRDLIYQANGGEIITVPAGFETDLASIPRAFQILIPVNGKHRKPAVIHDYLYANRIGKRGRADSVFLEAMKSVGVSWWKRRLMYAAVRVGGRFFWKD